MSDNGFEIGETAPAKNPSSKQEHNNLEEPSVIAAAATTDTTTTTARRSSIHTVRQIEERIGCVFDEFKCQHNNFTGILYVGPLGVVFLGRFLLFEWTVFLQWEEITKVKKSTYENKAIRIEAKGGIYDFDRFFDSHKALEILIALHNGSFSSETLLGSSSSSSSSTTTRQSIFTPRALKRSNSDPPPPTLFDFDEPPLVFQQDNETTTIQQQYKAYGNKAALRYNAGIDAPQKQVIRRSILIESNNDVPSNTTTPIKNNDDNDDKEEEESWETICQELLDYPHVAVEDRELPGGHNVESFFASFLEDTSAASLGRFMEDVVGDKDISVSEWKDRTRTIEYTHPVNAPMAPPTARARKEQRLRHYSPKGLVLETKTVVSDVPMTDCFYVRDVLKIETRPDDRLVLTIRFDVVFVKSTLFRSLIARTTIGEFERFMNDLTDYLCQNCGAGGEMIPSPKHADHVPSKPDPPKETTILGGGDDDTGWKFAFLGVLLWIAVLLTRILWELKSLRGDLLRHQQLLGHAHDF